MERAELRQLVLATGCAVEPGGFVFLCDPHWSVAEKQAFSRLVPPASNVAPASGWLCVRTGGSTGGLKFARHDEQTLSAAVRGFCAHFNLARINAVDVLPPWHVSGLMSRVRCAATGGTHLAWDWKKLERGDFPSLPATGNVPWAVSLVPTQLQRLLAIPAAIEWLRQFHLIFLGGGPAWPDLTAAAARARLPISLSYGLTETAAMVAAQRPAGFLGGDRSSGATLPHAQIRLAPDGRIAVSGESVHRGYFGAEPHVGELLTEDLGRIDEHGHLHVLGRADALIITGGKKVNPAEVEAALRASGEFTDIFIVGLPDPEWGQIVVACHPATRSPPDLAKAVAALAPHQHPKRFIPIANWPRNAQGKLSRDELLRDLR